MLRLKEKEFPMTEIFNPRSGRWNPIGSIRTIDDGGHILISQNSVSCFCHVKYSLSVSYLTGTSFVRFTQQNARWD